ncbi:MFS transporter [Nakamurella silvestris]|nr:MFS transporter [Nakamurella silvestris]
MTIDTDPPALPVVPPVKSDQPDTRRAGSVFAGAYLLTSIGALALVFLGAFESLAVTTVMPVVSRDLDGASLYAMAFAAPLAMGVIGMVVAGSWADRSGPGKPLYLSATVFAVGLVIAGTAGSMGILVLGRLVQGLGSGAITVSLYVLVARVYPATLHPKIFGYFAAAWAIPSLVGPALAGFVAEVASWHWVFLGVVGLVPIAVALVVPAVRQLTDAPVPADRVRAPWDLSRLAWATVAAVAVLILGYAKEFHGFTAWLLPVLAGATAVVAARGLLPGGTLLARHGLPSVIAVRGLVSAAFFGAEIYLPYLLTDRYQLTPTVAGLALTGAALAWATASWAQGKLGTRLTDVTSIRIGAVLLLFSIALVLVTALVHLPAFVAVVGWVFSGAGMGLMSPRLSSLTLAYSNSNNQGFNSSAMSIADSFGASLSLAATGIVFGLLVTAGGAWSFVGSFALTLLFVGSALLFGGRVSGRNREFSRPTG